MKSWRWNINGFFCAIALAVLFCGCQTRAQRRAEKDGTLVNLFIETHPDGTSRTQVVPIYRSSPQMVTIRASPFLTNADIAEAELAEVEGGFAIRIVFDHHGTMVLENYTASNPGRRIAVSAAFPEIRWLAAPKITRRIADGVYIFTPDATREEAERIVKGMNLVAELVKKGRL